MGLLSLDDFLESTRQELIDQWRILGLESDSYDPVENREVDTSDPLRVGEYGVAYIKARDRGQCQVK